MYLANKQTFFPFLALFYRNYNFGISAVRLTEKLHNIDMNVDILKLWTFIYTSQNFELSTFFILHKINLCKNHNAKFWAKVSVYTLVKINAILIAFYWKSLDHGALSWKKNLIFSKYQKRNCLLLLHKLCRRDFLFQKIIK